MAERLDALTKRAWNALPVVDEADRFTESPVPARLFDDALAELGGVVSEHVREGSRRHDPKRIVIGRTIDKTYDDLPRLVWRKAIARQQCIAEPIGESVAGLCLQAICPG